jgi:uncharacterized protein YkwD
MKREFFTLVVIAVSSALYSQRTQSSQMDNFRIYKELNDRETRLPEYKDSDAALRAKLLQVDLINSSRKRYNAGTVKLDILASRVSNKMCREAAENGYLSHWNMAGEKPYHRYAFAGGLDHVSENAYMSGTSGVYENTVESAAELMAAGHKSFMSERAPYDGHLKNVIEKDHNFVGLGYAIAGGEFRYYEEYVNRYLEFENIPAELRIGETGTITIKTDGNVFPVYILAYRDLPLRKMSVDQLNQKGAYGDFTDELSLQIPAWDLSKYKDGNSYKIPVSFTKQGLYYVNIYIDNKPYTGSMSLTTEGKTVASGIVIRVN